MTMTVRTFSPLVLILAFVLCLFVVPSNASAEKITHKIDRYVDDVVKDEVSHIVMKDRAPVVRTPSNDVTPVGTLKKGTIVIVYDETKNKRWAKIEYKGRTGYVSLNHLQVSYDHNSSLDYTYKSAFGRYTSTTKWKNKGWSRWQNKSGHGWEYWTKEDHKGLHNKLTFDDDAYTNIKYPVKQGLKWNGYDNIDGSSLTIISVNKTIKTKAGTVSNVVAVKRINTGYVNYYAPNVGWILETLDGKAATELVRLQER